MYEKIAKSNDDDDDDDDDDECVRARPLATLSSPRQFDSRRRKRTFRKDGVSMRHIRFILFLRAKCELYDARVCTYTRDSVAKKNKRRHQRVEKVSPAYSTDNTHSVVAFAVYVCEDPRAAINSATKVTGS